MRFALMDIYHAKLLSNDGNFDADKAFALQLDYTRTISKRRLIEETRNQLLRTGTNNKNTIEKWTGHLKTIWPDIKPGDSITLFVNNEQQSIFYINHKLAGVIHDTEFTSAFSGIWLSPRTSRPKLRKNLLSIKK